MPKDALAALKLASGTPNGNPDPRGKIVQKYKILSICRNCVLSLKLETTPQDKSWVMFVFQNGALEVHK